MAILTKLSIANPLNTELRKGRQVEVYGSATILAIGATFNTPDSKMREQGYNNTLDVVSVEPAADDWISWGDARFVRVKALSDEVSVVAGVTLEYSIDGSALAGSLFVGSALANEQLDSDWLEKKGTHFRYSYVNGATIQGSFDTSVEVSEDIPDNVPAREGVGASFLDILNEMHRILGTSKSNIWPCFEEVGSEVLGFAANSLIPSDEVAARALEVEFIPILTLRDPNIHAYFLSASLNRHFVAADHVDYSFEGAAEGFSLGIWVLPKAVGTIQSLISKYDEGLTTEYSWTLAADGTIVLDLFDGIDGATGDLNGVSTVVVDEHELQFLCVTYAGAKGEMIFYRNGELENAADAVTPIETLAYVNMDDTAAKLFVGARDVGGAPQELLNGWMTLPFVAGRALPPSDVRRMYQLGSMLVGTSP